MNPQCSATTASGTRCRRRSYADTDRCYAHRRSPECARGIADASTWSGPQRETIIVRADEATTAQRIIADIVNRPAPAYIDTITGEAIDERTAITRATDRLERNGNDASALRARLSRQVIEPVPETVASLSERRYDATRTIWSQSWRNIRVCIDTGTLECAWDLPIGQIDRWCDGLDHVHERSVQYQSLWPRMQRLVERLDALMQMRDRELDLKQRPWVRADTVVDFPGARR